VFLHILLELKAVNIDFSKDSMRNRSAIQVTNNTSFCSSFSYLFSYFYFFKYLYVTQSIFRAAILSEYEEPLMDKFAFNPAEPQKKESSTVSFLL